MKFSLTTKVNAVLVLMIASLVAIGLFSHQVNRRGIEDARLVAHTQEVLRTEEKILSLLVTAESGWRGYLLSGEESFLDPYQTAIQTIEPTLQSLRQLTAGELSHQQRLDDLDVLVPLRLALGKKSIDFRRANQAESADLESLAVEGNVVMDRIRVLFQAMADEENKLLQRRLIAAQASSARASVTILGGTLMTALFFFTAAFFINHDLRLRMRAENEIHRLNTELEERVLQRTAQLEAANSELEAFSYSVSHDLRAPLRSVNGYVSMLEEDCADQLDAEGNRLLGVISSEAKRMGRLIDDLLSFSRLGRQKVERMSIDMTRLVRGEFEYLTRAEPASAPRLELETLPAVSGDLAMLRQVFSNLLSNAIKFSRTRRNPLVQVGSSHSNGEITFHVKDNGVGFDERYRDKLFGVFQRLHSQSEFEGTGVGLALVQRIIHRHGGKVWAESKLNKGATFSFTLPTHPPTRDKQHQS